MGVTKFAGVTRLAVRKAPVPVLALVTLPSKTLLVTVALSSELVTELVLGADVMAVATGASAGAESVRGRRASVAGPSHHQLLAITFTVVLVTEVAVATRGVAFTWAVNGSLEHVVRDGTKQLHALLGHFLLPGWLRVKENVITNPWVQFFVITLDFVRSWAPSI